MLMPAAGQLGRQADPMNALGTQPERARLLMLIVAIRALRPTIEADNPPHGHIRSRRGSNFFWLELLTSECPSMLLS